MRRFLALAMITALGAWLLKRLAAVGNDNACYESMPHFSDEEEDLQSKTGDDPGDEVIPPSSDEEFPLESQPVDSVVDEAPPSSDEEIDLQSQTVDDPGDEVTPWSLDEIDFESHPLDSVADDSPPSSDEEIDLRSQNVVDLGGNVIPWPREEEVHLESRPAEACVSDGVEIQGPLDLDQRPRAADDWSLPVGPDGEEKLRQARTEVDDRLHELSHRPKRDDRAAA